MRGLKRGLTLVGLLLATLAAWTCGLAAQVATTTVQDTVYRADGTTATGTVVVSWNAFTTAGGQAVPAGTTSATIGSDGVVTLALAPNAGSTPMGSYYTAVFHLNDGTTSREYWVVPVTVPGGGAAKLAAIRNQVLPASVAMQTVSKAYVDNAIAAAATGFPTGNAPYVQKTGDAMAGPLLLPADPVSANQAADKNYVDTNIAAVASGLGQKVSSAPAATQTVVQPSGTQLQVNNLNGQLYATQYVNGQGNNGISNALSSPDCGHGCEVKAEATYTSGEQVNGGTLPANAQVVDTRGGAEARTTMNPLGAGQVFSSAENIHQIQTLTEPQLEALRPGAVGMGSAALQLTTDGLAGGSNQFPEQIETVPYGKSTYGTLQMDGRYNTQGQHVQMNNNVNCYAVGDCLAGGQFVISSGGYRDSADEGAHPWDLTVTEDLHVFKGSCSTGCTTGSTNVGLNNIVGGGTQGDGRFLIDMNPAKVISSGTIVGGGRNVFGTAGFSGTNFPVSVFLSAAAAATSQPGNLMPGTVTLPISTSGVPAGFATSTSALPAGTGTACVADPMFGQEELPNYEMAPYRTIDASHIQLTLNKVHGIGATIAVGGLCGYGLEQTVDTTYGLRQLFPVVGSTGPGSLYYADGMTSVVGNANPVSTSGFQNITVGVAAITRQGNISTVTTAGNLPVDVNGLTFTVSGVADASFNGRFVVTTTGANTLTYANTGADGDSSGGTLSMNNGGFALYPMAEVLSVMDPANKQIDGQFTLAPNTVAWAAGDALEEPHYYQQLTYADTELVTQFVPRPIQYASQGKVYQGQVGPGFRGWQIANGVPTSNYLGGGGTHQAPDDAHLISGVWNNDFEMDAGVNALIRAHCNLHGCNRWDSGYHLFDLDSSAGEDFLNYDPNGHSTSWNLAGTFFTFAPSGFYAGTINVGTLNATTVNGSISGAAVTSGTINAARLPVFGASGTAHGAGVVPDPGAAAGITRFLREDGTWNVPVGAGGAASGSAGGDLSGSYPSPTVAAVHATSGSLSGLSSAAIGDGSTTNGDLLNIQTNNPTENPYGFAMVNSGSGSVGFRMCNATQTGCGSPNTGQYWQSFVASNGNFKVGKAFVGDFMVIDGTGRVGIGTEAPAALFNVGAANQFQVDGAGHVSAASVTAANGYTGTKTVGTCTLVIQGGIITNVTGC